MSRPKKALHLTCSEHGQANVHLAVAHSLLQQDPTVEIHIGSFSRLASFAKEASDFAINNLPNATPFKFHKIPGTPYVDCILHPDIDFFSIVAKTPGFWTSFGILKGLARCMTPWSAQQFLEIYNGVVRMIEEVDPDIVIVDNFFCPGLAASHNLKRNWVILSPNTLKDFAGARQPNMAGLWKYPRFGLINEFPIPWYKVPLNIFYSLCSVYYTLSEGHMDETTRLMKDKTGKDLLSALDIIRFCPPVPVLVSNHPEIDFPVELVPDVVPCGPIIRPAPDAKVADPELAEWLTGGPTVLINLGSHCLTHEDMAIEMAKALRVLFDEVEQTSKLTGLRVLWKIKQPDDEPYSLEVNSPVYQILGKEMSEDRVRIQKWLKVEPAAILDTKHVICSVNHGGASSFNEAVCAGVPQVVLAQWIDTFDYALRAEINGIGLYGNREARPYWSARELGPKLIEATSGESAARMREKAQGLAKIFREAPEGTGRDFAARFILERA